MNRKAFNKLLYDDSFHQYIVGEDWLLLCVQVCLRTVWRGGIPVCSHFTTVHETRVSKMTRPGDLLLWW